MACMLSHYLNLSLPPALQDTGLHVKSVLKSSTPLPHKTEDYMQSHHLNLPPMCPTKQWATCFDDDDDDDDVLRL